MKHKIILSLGIIVLVGILVGGIISLANHYNGQEESCQNIAPVTKNTAITLNIKTELPERLSIYSTVSRGEDSTYKNILSFCNFDVNSRYFPGASWSNGVWSININDNGEIFCKADNWHTDNEPQESVPTYAESAQIAIDFLEKLGIETNTLLPVWPWLADGDDDSRLVSFNFKLDGKYDVDFPSVIYVWMSKNGEVVEFSTTHQVPVEIGTVHVKSLKEIEFSLDNLKWYLEGSNQKEIETIKSISVVEYNISYIIQENNYIPYISLKGIVNGDPELGFIGSEYILAANGPMIKTPKNDSDTEACGTTKTLPSEAAMIKARYELAMLYENEGGFYRRYQNPPVRCLLRPQVVTPCIMLESENTY